MRRLCSLLVLSMIFVSGHNTPVFAQDMLQMPLKAKKKPANNSGQELSFGNSKEPIQIDADSLEVRDKEKLAIFTGNVVAVQGAGRLTTKTMKVFYEDNKQAVPAQTLQSKTLGNDSAVPNSNNRKIKRIETFGAVRVEQNGQIGTGDTGVYDMQNGFITLQGNVSMTQNGNVVQGDKLVVNTKTQESVVTSHSGAQKRVRALIQNSEEKKQ